MKLVAISIFLLTLTLASIVDDKYLLFSVFINFLVTGAVTLKNY